MSKMLTKRYVIREDQEIVLAINKIKTGVDSSQVVRDALDMYFAANNMKVPEK
jgi:hypothetical protein